MRIGLVVVASMVMALSGCAEISGNAELDESEAKGGKGSKQPDAAPPPPDAAPPAPSADAGPPPEPASCELVYNGGGCAEGEKCTFVVTSHEPLTGYRACTPATTENHGYYYECSFDENGVDDCSPGFYCYGPNGSTPTCWPFCEAEAFCYPGTCWGFGTDIPADMTPDGYGLCI